MSAEPAPSTRSFTPLTTDSFTYSQERLSVHTKNVHTSTSTNILLYILRSWMMKVRTHFRVLSQSELMQAIVKYERFVMGCKRHVWFSVLTAVLGYKTPQSLKVDTQWLLITKGRRSNCLAFVWSLDWAWFCITSQLLLSCFRSPPRSLKRESVCLLLV